MPLEDFPNQTNQQEFDFEIPEWAPATFTPYRSTSEALALMRNQWNLANEGVSNPNSRLEDAKNQVKSFVNMIEYLSKRLQEDDQIGLKRVAGSPEYQTDLENLKKIEESIKVLNEFIQTIEVKDLFKPFQSNEDAYRYIKALWDNSQNPDLETRWTENKSRLLRRIQYDKQAAQYLNMSEIVETLNEVELYANNLQMSDLTK